MSIAMASQITPCNPVHLSGAAVVAADLPSSIVASDLMAMAHIPFLAVPMALILLPSLSTLALKITDLPTPDGIAKHPTVTVLHSLLLTPGIAKAQHSVMSLIVTSSSEKARFFLLFAVPAPPSPPDMSPAAARPKCKIQVAQLTSAFALEPPFSWSSFPNRSSDIRTATLKVGQSAATFLASRHYSSSKNPSASQQRANQLLATPKQRFRQRRARPDHIPNKVAVTEAKSTSRRPAPGVTASSAPASQPASAVIERKNRDRIKIGITQALEQVGMPQSHSEFLACHKLLYGNCSFQIGDRIRSTKLPRDDIVQVVRAELQRNLRLIKDRL